MPRYNPCNKANEQARAIVSALAPVKQTYLAQLSKKAEIPIEALEAVVVDNLDPKQQRLMISIQPDTLILGENGPRDMNLVYERKFRCHPDEYERIQLGHSLALAIGAAAHNYSFSTTLRRTDLSMVEIELSICIQGGYNNNISDAFPNVKRLVRVVDRFIDLATERRG
jgi:hypothetical protein